MMTYLQGLLIISAVFIILERLFPRYERQGFFRPRLLTDLAYFIFSGHFLGVLLAESTRPLVESAQSWLGEAEASGWWSNAVAADWPLGWQFVVAFFAIDFMQWGVHNLLHRVPFLWKFHKAHHTIRDMDFWGSLRFHWFEVVVYRTVLYLPGVWFGFDGRVLFIMALVSTAIGHMNHANINAGFGPLGKFLNNPKMHIWHHHNEPDKPVLVNFGINLSLWDYLFDTAYVPDRPPVKLGFPDDEAYPQTFIGQLLYPLPAEKYARKLWQRMRGSAPAPEPPDKPAKASTAEG